MPAQRKKYKEPWIKSHSNVITMISQSAQKRQRLYTNQHLVKPYNEPTITVNGQKLKVVDKFTYLGSTLSRAVHIDNEVTARIAKASVTFGRLRANIWQRNRIKLDTKVFKAEVLPTLLYACETWTKRLNHVHLSCLRKLLKSSGKTRDSRHRGPEESRDDKHALCLKASTANVDWPCYKKA